MSKILVLGAHYDDIEVGMGGTLFRHAQKGDEVYIAMLDSDEFRTGDVEMRFQEQLCVLDLLGLQRENLFRFKMNDDSFYIINELDKIKADTVYAPFELDTHQSHRRCSYIGQSVCRKIPCLFFYPTCSAYNFNPNVFSLIDFEWKTKLLSCFKSQIHIEAINIERVKKRDSYWASLITSDSEAHAEGFVVRKMMYNI